MDYEEYGTGGRDNGANGASNFGINPPTVDNVSKSMNISPSNNDRSKAGVSRVVQSLANFDGAYMNSNDNMKSKPIPSPTRLNVGVSKNTKKGSSGIQQDDEQESFFAHSKNGK